MPASPKGVASTTALASTTADTFEQEVLSAPSPVLVDFWASHCRTCRAMEPVLEALAAEFDGRMRVLKLDVEAHPAVADRFGVRSLPTLLLFQGGEVLGRTTGFVPRHTLGQHLDSVITAN